MTMKSKKNQSVSEKSMKKKRYGFLILLVLIILFLFTVIVMYKNSVKPDRLAIHDTKPDTKGAYFIRVNQELIKQMVSNWIPNDLFWPTVYSITCRISRSGNWRWFAIMRGYYGIISPGCGRRISWIRSQKRSLPHYQTIPTNGGSHRLRVNGSLGMKSSVTFMMIYWPENQIFTRGRIILFNFLISTSPSWGVWTPASSMPHVT